MKRLTLYLIALAISITAHAGVLNVNPVVKVVCFYATDIEKPTHAEVQDYAEIMLNVQDHYRQQMKKHGYGEKTFSIDRKQVDILNIVVVAGTKKLREYPTLEVLVEDFPNEHRLMQGDNDNIQVIFLIGAWGFEGFDAVEIKICWGALGDRDCVHYCVIPTGQKDRITAFTAHELGQSFWLEHIDRVGFMMGQQIKHVGKDVEPGALTKQEAAILDKHRYFVNKPIETDASIASQPLPILWGSLKGKKIDED